ncbi:DUF4274 domain-containing protein [Rhizobium sp.]|jgi:hypothetical protein|uniref:DUF4274 domain-containing protein n=1 Tax=Rhizobium sp. TaxID=391 RepID=UPI002AA7BF2A
MVEKFRFYDTEQRAMIDWLSTRSPDVWHAVSVYLNFDFAEDVFEWILTRPECDLATAAAYFWRCEPSDMLEYLAKEPEKWREDDDYLAVVKLVDRVKAGFYSRSEILYVGHDLRPGEEMSSWILAEARMLRDIARDAGEGNLPWTLPESLVPPFGHRPAIVSAEENPETSLDVQRLLEALGTRFGLSKSKRVETVEVQKPRWANPLNWFKSLGTKKH